jgi:hypothetical protein
MFGKWQLGVGTHRIDANIMASLTSKDAGGPIGHERVQSESDRPLAFLHVYIFWPPSRHNFAATACLNCTRRD